MRNLCLIIIMTTFWLRTVEGFALVSPRHSRSSGKAIMATTTTRTGGGRRFLSTLQPILFHDSSRQYRYYRSRCFMSSVSPEAAPAPSTNGTQQQQQLQQQSSPRNKPSSSTLHSYSTSTTTATSEEAHHHPNQFWNCFCDLEVPEGRVVGLNLTTTVDDLLLEPTTAIQDTNNKHWIYAWLHPDEVAYATTQSSPSRRETFIIGRMALREALKRVASRNGQDDGTMALPTECNNSNNNENQHLIQHSIPPILKDQYGRPTMPPGYVGSISHKDRAGVGIVARDTTFFGGSYHGIGIDLERTTNPRRNIARRVLTEREIESLGQLEGVSKEEEVMLRFSLKECIYKAVHPLICQYVGFQEAEVTPHGDGTATVDWMLKSGAQVRLGEVTAHWQRLEGGEFFLSSSSASLSEDDKEMR